MLGKDSLANSIDITRLVLKQVNKRSERINGDEKIGVHWDSYREEGKNTLVVR